MMKSKKGFTLIELLIVIAIIGILAAIVMVALSVARKRAYDVRIKSDLSEVAKALEIAKTDNTLSLVGASGWTILRNVSGSVVSADVPPVKLIPTAPVKPISTGDYYIKINVASDDVYLYSTLSDASGWCVKNGNSFVASTRPASLPPSGTCGD